MAGIEQFIEVDVPVRTAYDQWTRFEDFPRFMNAVQQVRQIDATHLHWVAEAGGKREEWDAEITEQIPDERIAWRATSGHGNAGVVTFDRLEEHRTRVSVQMEHEAQGIVESVGAALGFDDRAVKRDLARFKEIVESQDAETGGGRGEVGNASSTERFVADGEVPSGAPQRSVAEMDVAEQAALRGPGIPEVREEGARGEIDTADDASSREDEGPAGSVHHPLI